MQNLTDLNPNQLKLYRDLLLSLAPTIYSKYHDIALDEFSIKVDEQGISEGNMEMDFREIGQEVVDTAYWIAKQSGL